MFKCINKLDNTDSIRKWTLEEVKAQDMNEICNLLSQHSIRGARALSVDTSPINDEGFLALHINVNNRDYCIAIDAIPAIVIDICAIDTKNHTRQQRLRKEKNTSYLSALWKSVHRSKRIVYPGDLESESESDES